MDQMLDRDPRYAEELRELLTLHDTSVEKAVAAVVTGPVLETLTEGGLKVEDVEELRVRLVEA